MRNNYLSLKGYFILLVLSLQFFNTKAQQTYTYNYTGAVQTVNLAAGAYQVECWGANGETAVGHPAGGVGGYSKGTYSVSSPLTIYIAVGGKGSLGATTNAIANGGWNCGGNGYGFTSLGAGGGGATHIATATGILSSLSGNQSAVVIVAGGGGASGYQGAGGNGGGLTGGNGNSGTGGTTGGTFGQGANSPSASGSSTGGGGGGGWFGGNLGSPGNTGGAGGGSGYIGGIGSGTTAQTGQSGFVSKPVVTGDGLVIITSLCNVGITTTSSLVCSGSSVTLTTNAASNYTWSTGNTTTTSIVVSPTSNTTYTVGGTGTNPVGCIGSAVITITVNNTPTVTINSSTTSACLGQSVTLTASGANTYVWTGSSPTVTNGVAFAPASTATYIANGTNACGTASAAVTVTVSALPILVSASSTTICASTAATLMAGGATTYTWMPGLSTQTNYVTNPAANTVYTVTGKTGSCQGVNTITITTKPNPTITIAASTATICEGGSSVLTASGALTYTWNPVVSSNPAITVNPTLSTVYTVIGTNAVNCNSSATQVILVSAKPVLNVTASNPLVCPGDASTLIVTGANTYLWESVTPGATLVVHPTSTTTYSVAGTGTNTCSNATMITVSVFDPTLSLSSSTAVCRGTNVNINASGMDNYLWSTGSGFSSISVTPTTTTTYSVSSNSTQGAVTCSVNGAVTVSVNPNPTVTASSSPTAICKGERAVITASGAATYSWISSQDVTTSVTVTPTADQTYTVAGVDANGCKGSGSVLVRVFACVGIENNLLNATSVLVYPNPSNGDLTISSDQAISLQISNELGQLIRTISITNTEKEVKINNLSAGVYFITGHNANGSVKQKLIITK